jgi:isopenicillin N synthase-like dioxygenase
MKQFEQLRSDIAKQGYSEIDFQVDQAVREVCMEDFLGFLERTPEAVKNRLGFMQPGKAKSEIGYIRRSKEEGNDGKEFFHYHPAFEQFMDSLPTDLEKIVDQVEFQNFMEGARNIYKVALETVLSIAAMIDQYYPGAYEKMNSVEGRDTAVLRFLKYDLAEETETIAKLHTDRGAYTLAIAESSPGLRIAAGGRKSPLEIVHRPPEKALFFPGRKLKNITGENDFPPSFHDVVQLPECIKSLQKGVARASIVFFAGHNARMDNGEI